VLLINQITISNGENHSLKREKKRKTKDLRYKLEWTASKHDHMCIILSKCM